MDLLTVQGLTKTYPAFTLSDVSFSLPAGYVMGFIGRNGAGKTTTIKAMLGLVKPDAGQVALMGRNYYAHEVELKRVIGLAMGQAAFYPTFRLSRITDVFRRFYDTWDQTAYRSYIERFELDETKKVRELSAGMRVKYSLALALSHDARLLVLDEPTSGLDPVSRDDLLDLFREVIEDGQRSILFSTHITTDLEKCADYITYIRDGRIVTSGDKDDFMEAYLMVRGRKGQLDDDLSRALIGCKLTDVGFSGLLPSQLRGLGGDCQLSRPSIEDIMVFHERKPRTSSRDERLKEGVLS